MIVDKHKVKILLLNNTYPTVTNPKQGGYVKSIVECLRFANIDVDLLTPIRKKSSFLGTIKAYLSFYLKIIFMKRKDYDFIYINHFPYVFLPLIFRFKRVKKAVHFHGGDIMPLSYTQKILNQISYFFIKTEYLFIVPSEYFKLRTKERIPKLMESKFIVSPSGGVDVNQFKIKEKAITLKTITIGFASGLSYNKGADDLIDLIKHFKDSYIKFLIIEYGADRIKYTKALKKYSNVNFTPIFDKSKMNQFYSKIDLLFFPTKGESLGLVALESMSCGTPVIGPCDFALTEIIENSVNGEKYNSNKKGDYIRAVKEAISHLDKYDTRPMIVKKYSKKSVVEQYKEIFK